MAPSDSVFRRVGSVAIILAVAALVFMSAAANAGNDSVVTQTAKGSFEDTVTGLKKGITANKLVIIKEVPLTQMLAMVGVKAEKMVTFEIFHPRYGKVIHGKDKDAFIDIPLRIFVQDQGGQVILRYRKPSAVFASYSALKDLGEELDKLFENIVASVAG